MLVDRSPVFFAFFLFWALLAISSFLFFHFNRDAPLKRRVYPIFLIGSSVILVTFGAYASDGHPTALIVLIPIVSLITFLNFRRISFCPRCGRTLYHRGSLGPASSCRH